jgi:hypothetical protein
MKFGENILKSEERRQVEIPVLMWLEDVEDDLGQLNLKRQSKREIMQKNMQPNNKHRNFPCFFLSTCLSIMHLPLLARKITVDRLCLSSCLPLYILTGSYSSIEENEWLIEGDVQCGQERGESSRLFFCISLTHSQLHPFLVHISQLTSGSFTQATHTIQTASISMAQGVIIMSSLSS